MSERGVFVTRFLLINLFVCMLVEGGYLIEPEPIFEGNYVTHRENREPNETANSEVYSAPSKGSDGKYYLGLYPPIDISKVEYQLVTIDDPIGYLGGALEMDRSKIIDAPEELDWREVPNRVGPVKDQGRCKSCYAFAVTALLQSQQARFGAEKMTTLSEQELVDCSSKNFGCNGGWPEVSIDDIISLGGIENDASYPYTAQETEDCKFNRARSVMRVRGYKKLAANETILKHALANYGPILVVFSVTDHFHEHLRSYPKIIYSEEHCNGGLNHAVLLIGYGTDVESGKPYWLLVSFDRHRVLF